METAKQSSSLKELKYEDSKEPLKTDEEEERREDEAAEEEWLASKEDRSLERLSSEDEWLPEGCSLVVATGDIDIVGWL